VTSRAARPPPECAHSRVAPFARPSSTPWPPPRIAVDKWVAEGPSSVGTWRPRVFDRGNSPNRPLRACRSINASPRVGRRAGSIELTLNRSANWRASPQRPFGAISPTRILRYSRGRVRRARAERAHRRSARSRPSIRRGRGRHRQPRSGARDSTNFLIRGAQLAALYDSDPEVVGSSVAGYVVKSLEDPIVPATVAVICVPPEAAQAVADRLVNAGIHALLTSHRKSSTCRSVPPCTTWTSRSSCRSSCTTHNGTGPLGGGLLHSLGILTPAPMRGA